MVRYRANSQSSGLIGYAYGTGDADADGLPDALERVIGSNPSSTDSDGDGNPDAIEFPLTGLSVSDPCQGPLVTCTGLDLIFGSGFE